MGAQMSLSVAKPCVEYCRELSGVRWDPILLSLSAEERRKVQMLVGPIDVELIGKLHEAVAREVFAGNRQEAAHEFRRAGASAADEMLDGPFSIFARFISPVAAFKRGGSILGSAYKGVQVEVGMDPDDKGGNIAVTGMDGFSYGSQRIGGWIERAIQRFGGHNARATEASWDAGRLSSNRLDFKVRWD